MPGDQLNECSIQGQEIEYCDGQRVVPDRPIIPFIEGDGVGSDIWKATKHVLDSAISRRYGGTRSIAWKEVFAGEKARDLLGEWVPRETIDLIRRYYGALKGPLTTPVGSGFRSLNVTLRKTLDLYAVVRPIRYIKGVPSPVCHPEFINIVVFRENTEDVYSALEWAAGSKESQQLLEVLGELEVHLPADSGIGIKHISSSKSRQLVRKAVLYAIRQKCASVTLVHKGNIMKHTEGAFRDWGYQLVEDEFKDRTITEQELWDSYGGTPPEGRVLIKDRLADSMFQQILLRPIEYQVLATTNLNGDYLADALAAQVGGLGMAPGSSEGDRIALFEATHGTAPKYVGQNKVNPGSLILSGVMLLRWLGWEEAASSIELAFDRTVAQRRVTYDIGRQLEGATILGTEQFAEALVENLD